MRTTFEIIVVASVLASALASPTAIHRIETRAASNAGTIKHTVAAPLALNMAVLPASDGTVNNARVFLGNQSANLLSYLNSTANAFQKFFPTANVPFSANPVSRAGVFSNGNYISTQSPRSLLWSYVTYTNGIAPATTKTLMLWNPDTRGQTKSWAVGNVDIAVSTVSDRTAYVCDNNAMKLKQVHYKDGVKRTYTLSDSCVSVSASEVSSVPNQLFVLHPQCSLDVFTASTGVLTATRSVALAMANGELVFADDECTIVKGQNAATTKKVYIGAYTGIYELDLTTGATTRSFIPPSFSAPTRVVQTFDVLGSRLFAALADNSIVEFSTTTKAVVRTFSSGATDVRQIKAIASSSGTATARLWVWSGDGTVREFFI